MIRSIIFVRIRRIVRDMSSYKLHRNTVEPGYNDIGLYDTSPNRVRLSVVPNNSSL
jgi:hypothetical protein